MANSFLLPERFTLGLADGHTIGIDRSRPDTMAWRGLDWPTAVGVTEPRPGIVRILIPSFISLGRKHSLFAGSDGGAPRWAVIASLVETAKLNAIKPFL